MTDEKLTTPPTEEDFEAAQSEVTRAYLQAILEILFLQGHGELNFFKENHRDAGWRSLSTATSARKGSKNRRAKINREIMKRREKILSLNESDFKWQYFRGSGKGGQKRNKTSNACRCIHEPSGAVGEAEDGRSQLQNRKLAFERMAKSSEFQTWIKLQHDIYTGKVKLEIRENDKWVDTQFQWSEKGAK